jgi:hypothetical protein
MFGDSIWHLSWQIYGFISLKEICDFRLCLNVLYIIVRSDVSFSNTRVEFKHSLSIPSVQFSKVRLIQFLKQVARYTVANSYTTMKRMACNKSRWKAANQSKDWRIRRRRSWFPESYVTCFVCVFWCSFFTFWRDEKAISAQRYISLREVYTCT